MDPDPSTEPQTRPVDPARRTPPPIRYGEMARRAPEGDIDFDALFDAPGPGDAPRELEIGFGRGRFLVERARSAPGSRILGIEIKAKWGHLVEERRKREGLTHVVALAGDARQILPRLRPRACLARVFLHFPDPWWKKKHGKRRVLDDDFLAEVSRLLAPGGELFVQTDVEDRALEMRERIEAFAVEGAPAFSMRGAFDQPNPYGARSNREARADEDHLPVYRVLAIRR
ncbi:MAG: tRNA (guanosine(46)-N7)-methyltransferase TrmB [Sandaracinaceae bacterium]|nr:tRNA (guanosine(46)-N7)-methyltransferase TrmB [Sandaracinaceae bacterium]